MKRIKVLIDFLRLSVAEKIVLYRNVIARIKANEAIFTNLDESLDSATTFVDAMEIVNMAAADG